MWKLLRFIQPLLLKYDMFKSTEKDTQDLTNMIEIINHAVVLGSIK